MTEQIEFTLIDGPVDIQNHDGAKIENSYSVWNGISAREFYPPVKQGGANYTLTLTKSVNRAEDISAIEDDMTKALLTIAFAWVFSGGSHMQIERREAIISRRFTSNVEAARARLLAASGQTSVSTASRIPLGWVTTYSQPPLCIAVKIAKSMRDDFFIRKIVSYYDGAFAGDQLSWALSVYKVRDLLEKKFNGAAKVQSALAIKKEEWKRFGCLLNNNDLRHAEISGAAPKISRDDVNWVNQTARSWVAKYLRKNGVSAID